MSSFQAFPVYDYKTGLYYKRDPWLFPKDGFAELFNARLYQGKVQKRAGVSLFDKMPHQVRSESIGSSGSTNYTGTLANTPVRSGDPQGRFQFTDGSQVLYDEDGDGSLSGDGSGTIDYDTGDYDITFSSSTGGAVTADYQYIPGLPITGIFAYYSSAGSSNLLIFDTRRCAQYFPNQGKLHDIVEADTWSGDYDNFVWFENWVDHGFITNNVDRVKQYDGSSFSDLNIDIDDDGSNEVDTCLLIFSYKQRLILLRTTENGEGKPQRARWCVAGDWSDWTNDGYVDAPTLDWIMGGAFLGDDLVIFFERSIWALQYTGDADLPFRWKKLVSTEGAYAPFSVTSYSDELIALGPTGLIGTDGFDVTRLDEKVPDIALNFDMESYHTCYGAVLEEEREDWLTYPQIGSQYADRVLSLNYISNSWSIYDVAVQCLGYWQQAEEPTWDQIDLTFDEMERTWDERSKQAGYPITLGGTSDGKIVNVSDGGDDLGDPIKLEIKTGRINPYWEKGLEARLGWVEFLFTTDPDITLYLDFYADFDTTPYLTQEVQLDGDGDKTWRAVDCGETAQVHQIVIRHEAKAQTAEIHAMTWWFKPAGRIDR
jgi:hypothetical protein